MIQKGEEDLRVKKSLLLPAVLGISVIITRMIFSGLTSTRPLIRDISEGSVVVAFGDSITYGTGADRDSSYPAVLSDLLEITVINEGVPGEEILQGLQRLKRVLDTYSPQLLILCAGGNDILRGRPEREIGSDLRKMLEMLVERDVDVILIGVPSLGITLEPPGFYEDLAREFNVPYEGKILKKILSSADLKSDQVHPDASGYRLLAEAVARLIERSGWDRE